MRSFSTPLSFEWDDGNSDKNWKKHKVTRTEAEEIFFDINKKLYPDPLHSGREARKLLVGKTKNGRVLFIVFTIRKKIIRVISARDLNK